MFCNGFFSLRYGIILLREDDDNEKVAKQLGGHENFFLSFEHNL